MTQKIVVLAAGNGTRMLEFSKDLPKHLIQVKARPFLYYHLQNIKAAGFKSDIILVVGYQKEKMIAFARDYQHEFSLTLVDQFAIIGSDKYGTACPVAAVQSYVADNDFVVVNGDTLYSVRDLQTAKNLDAKYCYVAGYHHPEPQRYGLMKTDNHNYLRYIIEKPKPDIDFDSHRALDYLVNVGIYKFTPEIFEAIRHIDLSARGEYELTDAVSWLAQKKRVKTFLVQDDQPDLTKPSDIAKTEKYLEESTIA